jgi:hypothetical protein
VKHTVNVEEWQEGQNLVAFIVWAAFPVQVPTLSMMQLYYIRADVLMRQHNTLGFPCCPARVHQESKVFSRVDLGLPISCSARNVTDTGEVSEFACRIALVASKRNHILLDTHNLACCPSYSQELILSDQCLCSGVLKLESQFVDSVGGIGGTDDSAGPVSSPCY